MTLTRTAAAAAIALGAFAAAPAHAIPVSVELALLVDVSGSVSTSEFNLQRTGYVNAFLDAGIQAAIITGRQSPLVERRARELGIAHLFQGQEDKRAAFAELLARTGLDAHAAAYMGDDLPDLPLLRQAGLALTVADGDPRACAAAHWISSRPGGRGAVREACELILAAQGQLDTLLARYA